MANTGNLGQSDREVAGIIGAFDGLVDAIEHHIASLETELPKASASGDHRYHHRVERGLEWSKSLLETLENDNAPSPSLGSGRSVLERIMALRHNAKQLEYARDGKMV